MTLQKDRMQTNDKINESSRFYPPEEQTLPNEICPE